MSTRPAGPTPAGTVRWVLDSDERTQRLLRLLYPVCAAVVVVAVCAALVVSVVVGHGSPLADTIGGALGLTGGLTGMALRRRQRKRRS